MRWRKITTGLGTQYYLNDDGRRLPASILDGATYDGWEQRGERVWTILRLRDGRRVIVLPSSIGGSDEPDELEFWDVDKSK